MVVIHPAAENDAAWNYPAAETNFGLLHFRIMSVRILPLSHAVTVAPIPLFADDERPKEPWSFNKLFHSTIIMHNQCNRKRYRHRLARPGVY